MDLYLTFSAEDFACDEDFVNWVKYPDRNPDLDIYWRTWVAENGHKRETLEEARNMVLAVIEEPQYLPDDEKEREIWRRIQQTARLPKEIPLWKTWYSKAAAVLLILGAGGWYSMETNTEENISIAETPKGVQYVKQINNANHPKTIILSDGTSIILQPHSVLEYPETFQGDKREVFLTGQAFFEVTREANRPFLVQAGDIVTRVLGTSFTVRNFEGENNVVVQVKTGKVSVFRSKDSNVLLQQEHHSVDGVVLMPNQQVLYEREEMKMTKSLVENPAVLIPLTKHDFEFEDAPIKDVFAAIEEAYGVDIVYDEDALSQCYLNASLNDVALYGKLKLICRGINATYEVIDSHILIYGSGCHENSLNQTENPI